MPAIEAVHLRRTFRPARSLFRAGPEIVAVDDASLEIERGVIFGLLGHNGAGKTTTIKMLSTLLIPTGGTASVAGYDVATQERQVRQRLGVVLGGDRGLYGKLTARDNLSYFGHLYGMKRDAIPGRVEAMLDLVDLTERGNHRVEGFSRGMKQRLHLAKALLHDPPVIFLDEPSIGLDPAAAVNLRKVIKRLVPEHTVLLTTHYLHEADELCDRIAIIDQGRILVEDTSRGIKRRVGGEQRYTIQITGTIDDRISSTLQAIAGISRVDLTAPSNGTASITMLADEGVPVVDDAVRVIQGQGLRIDSVQAADLTLEDAFLSLTNGGGHAG